jgi:serine/threonine protein kinase
MENGSLEDQLFHRGARASLPWYIRFRIASEIASALYFFHTAKAKPIVHRDLEPANILLDHNFVSKVSDVGLPRLIPPPVSCTYTEYKNAVLAGTFCYMDPEYVLTGTLRPTSDLYALGIILLQLLAGQPPIAIKEKVQTAIQQDSFNEILDKTAGEWPLEETIEFAQLALKCTELLSRDRPDLETLVLPKLKRFKDIANAHAKHCTS